MAVLLDTNIAILLRDGDLTTQSRLSTLTAPPVMSVITAIELENGLSVKNPDAAGRRARTDLLYSIIPIVPFESDEVTRYRQIMETLSFSRRKTLDRMIAATALTNNLQLATLNTSDFEEVDGLHFYLWSD